MYCNVIHNSLCGREQEKRKIRREYWGIVIYDRLLVLVMTYVVMSTAMSKKTKCLKLLMVMEKEDEEKKIGVSKVKKKAPNQNLVVLICTPYVF